MSKLFIWFVMFGLCVACALCGASFCLAWRQNEINTLRVDSEEYWRLKIALNVLNIRDIRNKNAETVEVFYYDDKN